VFISPNIGFQGVSLTADYLSGEYMAWKKNVSIFVIIGLVCYTGLAQESRQTRELQQKIRVDSVLVVPTVTVKDDHGKFVPGLLQDDFHIFDDGVEQNILSFTDESLPLSLLILVDDDMKWRGGMPLARSVRSIIGDIADQDEAMVCRYDMLFYPGNEFTSHSTKLMADLKSVQSASLRFFAALEIAALPAADNTRFFAPFTSTAAEWLRVCVVYQALVR
jgi:hypothetical protein